MQDYDLEIENAVAKIEKENAKKVMIQLPEGMKPKAKEIVDELRKKTDAEVFVWLGSCYGACDVPIEVERLGIDLIIQWGHSVWVY